MIKYRLSEEHKIQCLAVKFLRTRLGDDFIIYAIPNGGKRTATEGLKLKDEGVLAGMPDLCIPMPRAGYPSLYIEVKKPGGKLSHAQLKMHASLISHGHKVVVCESVRTIILSVYNYLHIEGRALEETETMLNIKEAANV